MAWPRAKERQHVSIHAPAWGATDKLPDSPFADNVSIHAPAWGATAVSRGSPRLPAVSIHAPAWGATELKPATTPTRVFQFTLPHGERPCFLATHAGGASFNSRSRMGSDITADTTYPLVRCFNSRSRMGSDLAFLPPMRGGRVSIHAPAWGATEVCYGSFHARKFQFTLPHGERLESAAYVARYCLFQFTLPHGERLTRSPVPLSVISFQFTLPHGERRAGVCQPAPAWSFQFTLPHGERPSSQGSASSELTFQFTLPHGERHGAQS